MKRSGAMSVNALIFELKMSVCLCFCACVCGALCSLCLCIHKKTSVLLLSPHNQIVVVFYKTNVSISVRFYSYLYIEMFLRAL